MKPNHKDKQDKLTLHQISDDWFENIHLKIRYNTMSNLELNFTTLTLMKSSDMFGAMENYIQATLYDGEK